MYATAWLVVERDDRGYTVPTTLYGEAPLLLRMTGRDAGSATGSGLQIHLVGGAAGPLGGDRSEMTVDVGVGTRLTVRSVAASLAQPGRVGTCGTVRSTGAVDAVVAADAFLDWWPEPLISVRGSDHVQKTTVAIADETATVRWVDEVVLGRHEESSGRLTVHQRFTVGGHPVLHHTVTFDPSTAGIGRSGAAHVVLTALVFGIASLDASSRVDPGLRAVCYPLSRTCTAWIVLADDLDRARDALAGLGLERDSGPCTTRARAIDRVETSA